MHRWVPFGLRWLVLWLPLVALATGMAATVYGVAQQSLRSSANDPQLALAQDAAARLDAGAAPSEITAGPSVELATSLLPSTMVFDTTGRLLTSSAILNGRPPSFPPSVLTHATEVPHAVTWQPASGVREAAVATGWKGGYVVVARSLRTVEQREDQVLLLTAAGWVGTVGLTAIACAAAILLSGPVGGAPGPAPEALPLSRVLPALLRRRLPGSA